MKIKEFCKKNRRVIKIAGIITAVVITGRIIDVNYIIYNTGHRNGVVYATRKIAGVLSMDERNDIGNRLIKNW